jgi:hypothetical protein
MAKAVCRRPLNAETRLVSQGSPCGNFGGKNGSGTGAYFVSIIPPMLYNYSFIYHRRYKTLVIHSVVKNTLRRKVCFKKLRVL